MPKINFKEMVQTSRGNYKGRKIVGVKDDGQEWDTFVFEETKDSDGNKITNPIITVVSACKPGDLINIIMEKKGKFWNAKEAQKLEDGDGTVPSGTTPARSSGSGWKGKSNNTYRSVESQERSAAAYLAEKLLSHLLDHECLGKKLKEDLIMQKFRELTEEYVTYFGKGTFGGGDPVADVPANLETTEEPAPPTDDDDIPF